MKFGLYALGGLFALWLVGLIIFAAMLPKEVPEYDAVLETYEAGIVLTGGQDRINTGLDYYAVGLVQKLFITGAGQGVDVRTLVYQFQKENPGYRPITNTSDISVGNKARSTVANAREVRPWVQSNQVRKALLITAGYHMPRSMLIFKRAMPGVKWVASPVYPKNYHPQFWWKDSRSLFLVVSEYHKYFFTYVFG